MGRKYAEIESVSTPFSFFNKAKEDWEKLESITQKRVENFTQEDKENRKQLICLLVYLFKWVYKPLIACSSEAHTNASLRINMLSTIARCGSFIIPDEDWTWVEKAELTIPSELDGKLAEIYRPHLIRVIDDYRAHFSQSKFCDDLKKLEKSTEGLKLTVLLEHLNRASLERKYENAAKISSLMQHLASAGSTPLNEQLAGKVSSLLYPK